MGTGFVGQVAHLVNYADMSNVKLESIAELRGNLGAKVARRYGIERQFPDHRAMIEGANGELDAVVAIVRREHTATVALDILEAGIPLFTEKPMAPTVAQGEELVAAAEKAGVLYSVGFMRRYDDGVQAAKKVFQELVRTEELGKPLLMRCFCFGGGDYCNISGNIRTTEPAPKRQLRPISPEWIPRSSEKEYESFLNVFVHDINLIRFLADETPIITGVDYRENSGVIGLGFDAYPGVFEFAHLQTDRYWEEGVEIIFSKGRIKLELCPAFLRNQPARVEIVKEVNNGNSSVISPQGDWTWAFKNQAAAFVDNVISKTPSIASGEDSLGDLVIIEKIWEKILGH